jgi:phosphate starvation-inducible membrane PsiE
MNRIAKLLVTLNGAMAVWASLVFLGFLRLDLLSWIMLNTCSPTQFVTIVALATQRRLVMNAVVPWLLFFGFGGLLIFSWSGYMIVAQISHLIMTITAVFVLVLAVKERKFKALITGIAIGVLALVPFRFYQDQFLNAHPELLRLWVGVE